MRIQVIANCQARPISSLIKLLLPSALVLEPIILHLSKAFETARQLEQIGQADVILTQLTSDSFQPAHLSTPAVKETFGDRVIVWPNIFYSGQQPYLRYFTHPNLGRLMGPMEALHDIRLHESWQKTGQVNETALQASDPEFVQSVRSQSLASLSARESLCDVMISDYIEECQDSQKLFFTFNHPSRQLLVEMLRRILAHLGQRSNVVIAEGPEFLDRYQVPSVWDTHESVFQGDSYHLTSTGIAKRHPGPPVRYDLHAICRAYSEIYESHEIFRTMDGVRLTPEFPSLETRISHDP